MKVSIITVCYNSANTIQKTIESVLNQSYKDIEYIIVDGASTDDTMKIVNEYVPLFGDRLHIISESDKGIYDAMNKGISIASGDIIGILNSDDYYEQGAVKYIVNAVTEDKYQILYGFVRMINESGMEVTTERISHNVLEQRMIAHPACFVTKSVYNDFGVFDLQYVSVADYDFMLRMYRNKEVNFIPVDAVITNFVLGGMSASTTAWLDLLKLKSNYNFISKKEYKKELIKNRVYKLIRK